MADEAFALSPINARAAMPSDADYDAIREAFMETSRGRWFLSEYAKRNRNADTRMVLDAVARIEQNIAAHKQPAGASGLSESLVAIHAIVGEARAEVARALAGLDNDAVLTAARDGSRVIREVSWTLRECGADVRICNLLDSQVAAIETGQRLVGELDRNAVLAAFDALLDRVHDLAGAERPQRAQPSRSSEEADSAAADADLPEAAMLAATESVAPAMSPAPKAAAAPQARAAETSVPDPALTIITGTATDELEFVEPGDEPVADESADPDMPSADVVEAQNGEITDVDSVLDLVAMEMSAPQPDEPSELEAAIEAARIELEQAEAAERAEAAQAATPPDLNQSDLAQSSIAELIAEVATPHEVAIGLSGNDEAGLPGAVSEEMQNFEIGERGEPLYVPQSPLQPAVAPVPSPAIAAAPAASRPETNAPVAATAAPIAGASASLGAALLASGVVNQPGQSRGDALAPLRRMSQPEKIAFFS